jgi:hypothetical protein
VMSVEHAEEVVMFEANAASTEEHWLKFALQVWSRSWVVRTRDLVVWKNELEFCSSY